MGKRNGLPQSINNFGMRIALYTIKVLILNDRKGLSFV